ncbi:hypothetical protein ACA910_001132 [Epithemia clementina (nom. ined.)]
MKESDCLTSNDRSELLVYGLMLTVIAGALNMLTIVLTGYIVIYFAWLLILGPIVIAKSCHANYKGSIKVLGQKGSAVCPACLTMGPMVEHYQENEGGVSWVTKLQCHSCGCITEHWCDSSIRSSNPSSSGHLLDGLPYDPIAKAQAILLGCKGKASKGNAIAEQKAVKDNKASY